MVLAAGQSEQGHWFSAVPTLFAYLLNDETPVNPVTIDRDRPALPGLHRRRYPRKSTVNLKRNLASRSLKRWALLKRVPRSFEPDAARPSQDRLPGVAVGNEIMIGDESSWAVPVSQTEKFWSAVTMSCRAILISQKKLQKRLRLRMAANRRPWPHG